MLFGGSGAATQGTGVDLPSFLLPPEPDPADCGALLSHYSGPPIGFGGGAVVFGSTSLRCFFGVVRVEVGNDEQLDFMVEWVTTLDFGSGPVPTTLFGPMRILVRDRVGNPTGVFGASIPELSLSGDAGGIPVSLRWASTSSSGSFTIIDLGGGMYHHESFLSIFVELSTDGGGTWYPMEGITLWLNPIDVPVELQNFSVK